MLCALVSLFTEAVLRIGFDIFQVQRDVLFLTILLGSVYEFKFRL